MQTNIYKYANLPYSNLEATAKNWTQVYKTYENVRWNNQHPGSSVEERGTLSELFSHDMANMLHVMAKSISANFTACYRRIRFSDFLLHAVENQFQCRRATLSELFSHRTLCLNSRTSWNSPALQVIKLLPRPLLPRPPPENKIIACAFE